jgi:hypothetical protein
VLGELALFARRIRKGREQALPTRRWAFTLIVRWRQRGLFVVLAIGRLGGDRSRDLASVCLFCWVEIAVAMRDTGLNFTAAFPQLSSVLGSAV